MTYSYPYHVTNQNIKTNLSGYSKIYLRIVITKNLSRVLAIDQKFDTIIGQKSQILTI